MKILYEAAVFDPNRRGTRPTRRWICHIFLHKHFLLLFWYKKILSKCQGIATYGLWTMRMVCDHDCNMPLTPPLFTGFRIFLNSVYQLINWRIVSFGQSKSQIYKNLLIVHIVDNWHVKQSIFFCDEKWWFLRIYFA